jgi:hypothetical protein
LQIPYEGLPDVDTYSIKFKDPTRETQRQARLVAEAAQQAAARAARDVRREKALTKPDVAEKRKRTHKGVQKRIFEDWDLLAREERVRLLSCINYTICDIVTHCPAVGETAQVG